jgi:hypothetical protein
LDSRTELEARVLDLLTDNAGARAKTIAKNVAGNLTSLSRAGIGNAPLSLVYGTHLIIARFA